MNRTELGITYTEVNLRFLGQYKDEETDLHYKWNRYYDSTMGRYVTSDPIGLDGGMNTYVYALNIPLIKFDVKGLRSSCSCDETKKVDWLCFFLCMAPAAPPEGVTAACCLGIGKWKGAPLPPKVKAACCVITGITVGKAGLDCYQKCQRCEKK